MIDPLFRSPRTKLVGLHHLGRMLDKIRCDLAGTLPEEYRPNLGLSVALDGFICGFLRVQFADVRQKISEGLSDDEMLEWCFATGLRPNSMQRRIWNGFSEKFGWRDLATSVIDDLKREEGLDNRLELQTAFDVIDEREGRGIKG